MSDQKIVRRRRLSPGQAEALASASDVESSDVFTQAVADRATGASPPKEPSPPNAVREKDPVPLLPGAWARVVTTTIGVNVDETFDRLERELSVGDAVGEYGTVIRALDASARNLYDAGRLARAAKIADEAYGVEADKLMEVLRTEARAKLEAEKAAGVRSKAPTIQDVEDKILATWPDRAAAIKRRRSEMHGMMRSIESLEGAWQARCGALKSLVDRFRTSG